MAFELPKLDYAYSALEPHIDAKTMEIHHSKHHQAYTDKLNTAVKATKFGNMDINDILKDISQLPPDKKSAIINNGGGFANHSFFWKILSPDGGELSGNVAKAIKEKFGSFENFKQSFSDAALSLFGSGWVWLVLDDSGLEIIQTKNQDSPLSEGKAPLLCIDLWEHSYYLKYQNRRADYIAAWWNVVDWTVVEENFKKAAF